MKLPPGHANGVVTKATAKGGFGQKMLERMGWQDGQGLGKNKHGMQEAIQVKQKQDNLGVGLHALRHLPDLFVRCKVACKFAACVVWQLTECRLTDLHRLSQVGASQSGWNWDWKYWEDAYNSAIQGVSHHKSSDSDSSDSSDEDEPALGAFLAVNSDGTLASASKEELTLANQLAKDPWGRFGGKKGKLARIRQQEEVEAARARAKLGLDVAAVSTSKGAVCLNHTAGCCPDQAFMSDSTCIARMNEHNVQIYSI